MDPFCSGMAAHEPGDFRGSDSRAMGEEVGSRRVAPAVRTLPLSSELGTYNTVMAIFRP